MHRAEQTRRVVWLRLASIVGAFAGWSVRAWPGVLGVGLLCWGVGMIYRPGALIVGGLFLLLLDKRMPD